MMTRISAEFETPDLAELALKRIRETVPNVFSTNIMYNKMSEKAVKLRGGNIYTIIPTAVTTHNYMTFNMVSPASEDVIPENLRNRRTIAYVICENTSLPNVKSVFNSMGGLKIYTPTKS